MAAPAHLSDAAKAVWAEITQAHADPAVIEGPDLEAFCVQVARMRDAQARIDAEGLVVADAKGQPIPHPAIALEKQAHAEVRAWGDRFRP
ncbi:P27 family phage terminase small subunit [Rhizomonospora bruguierae]|uniref:P27 family phage terminase small subunit n=1 Tax=Rhizomonospora bruguierae TaxID=1581705 RepID=UPI001BCF2285|nr:P27 family phage terminase small subunit [Micromonospora sp. NBRC 107566]